MVINVKNITFAYYTTQISIVMRKFYKLIAAVGLIYGIAAPASAQKAEKDYEPYPHMFVGVQGGVQNTFNNSFNNWKTSDQMRGC